MRLRPLPVGSYGALGLTVRLLLPSLRQRVSESSSLSAWSFPFRGLSPFLAFVPLLEALSESLTHSIPCSFLVVALSASAVGFADALWLCPERALRRFFASVSLFDPVALSPLLHRVFTDSFRLWCAFHFCGGGGGAVSPGVWSRRGPWGVAVAPPISPYTGPGWSPPICRVPLELGVGVLCFTVRHSARIHGDHLVSFTDSCVSLARHSHKVMFLGHLRGECLVGLTVLLLAIPGLCHLR